MTGTHRTIVICALLFGACWTTTVPTYSSGGSPPDSNTTLTATTDAPVYYPSPLDAVTLKGSPVADFLTREASTRITKFHTPVRKIPSLVQPLAIAGAGLSLGYRDSSWLVDGTDTSGYMLYYDRNWNGDLSDETPIHFSLIDNRWRTLVTARGENPHGVTVAMVLQVEYVPNMGLRVEYANSREGYILIDNQKMKFAVFGIRGYYGLESERIAFDLNRDGKFDANEQFYNRDGNAKILGCNYHFEVNIAGDVLTLIPARDDIISHSGSPAGSHLPQLEVRDIFGNIHTLHEKQHTYLVLDFWSPRCLPCVQEIPEIKALVARNSNVSILGVSQDSVSDLQDFVRKNDIRWVVISDDAYAGWLHSQFHIESYPSYVVVSPDGRVMCQRCSLREVSAVIHH
jgi:peroxiredoxin